MTAVMREKKTKHVVDNLKLYAGNSERKRIFVSLRLWGEKRIILKSDPEARVGLLFFKFSRKTTETNLNKFCIEIA